jgi:hypothetical protein
MVRVVSHVWCYSTVLLLRQLRSRCGIMSHDASYLLLRLVCCCGCWVRSVCYRMLLRVASPSIDETVVTWLSALVTGHVITQ